MNEVLKAIKERRSIRKFKKDKEVPEEIIEKIIEAGLYAANGKGNQSGIIIAVTNKELRDKISKANAQIMNAAIDPFYGAPVILIVLADKDKPTYIYDGSLIMGNLMLAAHSLNVDSIWIHRAKEEFEKEEYKNLLKELGVEGNYEGIGHCALGYSDLSEAPKAAPRNSNRVYWIK